jgi:ankyrin repeat protein
VFRLRTRGLPRIGSSFILRPFAPLLVEAVDRNHNSIAEATFELPHRSRIPVVRPALSLPPEMRPDVIRLPAIFTKLHAAAQRGDLRAIASLAKRPEFINTPDPQGRTAAAIAAREGQTEALRALVLLGADFRYAAFGTTLMHVSAQYNQVRAIRVLDSLGADVNGQDEVGATAMSGAAWLGQETALRVLHALGNVNSPDKNQIT